MTNPENDTRFFEVVGDMDFTETGIKDLESLDLVRDTILSDLTEHLITFRDLNVEDEDELSATVDALTLCINRDFLRIEGLSFDDEVIASGETIIMLIDNEDLGVSICPLSDTIKLRGSLAALAIIECPDISVLERVRNGNEEFDPTTNPIPMNYFSVVFVLKNASISSVDDDSEPIPENNTVVVPLNYPQLQLKRVV